MSELISGGASKDGEESSLQGGVDSFGTEDGDDVESGVKRSKQKLSQSASGYNTAANTDYGDENEEWTEIQELITKNEKAYNERYQDHSKRFTKVRYCIGTNFSLLIGPGWEWITPTILIGVAYLGQAFCSKLASCDDASFGRSAIQFIGWLAMLSLFWTAFTNPGHAYRTLSFKDFVALFERNEISCFNCLSLKSDNATHCEDCGICIKNYDHHCVVMGNCIGKYNLIPFYLMLAMTLTGICSLYVVTIYSLQKCYKSDK